MGVTAILLVSCPDQPGIVAAMAAFVAAHGGNIIDLQQHSDATDRAYFQRTVLVASAHNMPVESYPWRFSSVISVGSHEDPDPLAFYANPKPPVEFFAHGVSVDVAWLGGSTLRCTGNSFATPHISGVCATILGKHPELTAFQLKSVLYLIATNVGGGR